MVVLADRADHRCRLTALLRGPAELGMRIAHLVLGQASLLELRDERSTRQAVVDLPGCAGHGPPDGSRSEAHPPEASERVAVSRAGLCVLARKLAADGLRPSPA